MARAKRGTITASDPLSRSPPFLLINPPSTPHQPSPRLPPLPSSPPLLPNQSINNQLPHRGYQVDFLAAGLVIFLGALLAVTTVGGAAFNLVVTLAQLVIIVVILILGFIKSSVKNLTPFMPYGVRGEQGRARERACVCVCVSPCFARVGWGADLRNGGGRVTRPPQANSQIPSSHKYLPPTTH